MANPAQAASTAGYLAGWRLVRLLPERSAHRLFRGIADRAHRRNGRSVQRLRSNLARVCPDLPAGELEDLTREGVRSYLRYWCESFRLPSWPVADLVRRTRTIDEHRIREAYARGRGVVVPLPHMGNWDWAGAWACATGMPLATVAERLRPERLFDEFVAYRNTLGMEILPLTGGPPPMARLLTWVGDGGLACLLADRDLSRHGVEVTLCEQPARVPSGPAVLALRTGAPLLPVTLHYDDADMVITFHEPVPHDTAPGGARRMMQGVADAFSTAFRAHPQDWHMMQRVFAADLAPREGR